MMANQTIKCSTSHTTVWGGLFPFCEYLSRALQLSPTLQGPPNIILTFFLSAIWLAFPPNLGVFYLHGRALLATRLMFTCGLATTLGIVILIRYNTAIIPRFVCCVQVAYGVKYVCLLATTLGIAICCNTTIRPEFVHCALMTCG